MKKKKTHIVKEVSIFIILLILIMLILAVSLYDFIPSNINIPETIEYTADSETTSVKQEIAYTNGGDTTADKSTEQELVTSLKSYSIQASDLTVYGQKNLYNSGNSNPFDYAQETTTQDTTPAANDTTQNNPTGTTTNTTSQNTTAQAGTTQNNNAGETVSPKTDTTTPGTFFENPASK